MTHPIRMVSKDGYSALAEKKRGLEVVQDFDRSAVFGGEDK